MVSRTLLALLLAAMLLAVFPGRATAQETVHFIQPGENLFRIGLSYGVSWETLMAFNGLNSTQIYVGQRLLIPGAAVAAQQPSSGGLVHVVQAGETLSGIGARYGVAWPDLMAANGLASTRLDVGLALTLPGAVSVLPELGGQATSVGLEGLTHVVQPGETLFLIGLRYNITWHALAAANGLDSTRIYAGQVLLVPSGASSAPLATTSEPPVVVEPEPPVAESSYVVAPGDTLLGVAQRFGLAVTDLAAANGLTITSWLYAGQVLAVPGGTISTAAGAYLSVQGAPQSLPLDCESRSAVDWAAYMGVAINELEFFWSLPVSDNPDAGFVGDVYGLWGQIPPAPYGVHADPVAATLNNLSVPARAVHGMSWDDLRGEIDAGRPVIVWVIGQVSSGPATWYTASSGHTTLVAAYEHTVIVTGYTAGEVIVLDGARVYQRSQARFLDSWAVLGNMAIVAGP